MESEPQNTIPLLNEKCTILLLQIMKDFIFKGNFFSLFDF